MRKWVEYAVENYKGKNTFGFQLAKDLKERQIERAIERYARGVRPEEVAAILDTSAFRSGKTGFLLTDRYLYSDKCKEEGPIGLMYLKSVSVKPENNSCCVLTFEDDSIREIDVSVFLDVADVLELIIEQRQKAEAEEKEREQTSVSVPAGTEGTDEASGEADSIKEIISIMNQGGQESRVEFEDSDGTAEIVSSSGEDRRDGLEEDGSSSDGDRRDGLAEDGSSPNEDFQESAHFESLDKGERFEGEKLTGMGSRKIPKAPENGRHEMAGPNADEPGTKGMAIEIVGIEDLADPAESEEAREMRWLADFIQSEEGDWGDDTGTLETGQPEKDWMDEVDIKPIESSREQSEPGQEEAAKEEESRKEAEYEELLGKAEDGDPAAMFEVAELSYHGEQTVKDHKQALRWFRESAKAEYVPAMLQMMRFYEKGELVKRNLKLSMSWVKKAAATGEAQGRYALAEAYIYGSTGKQDVEEGLRILDEMAADGDETALAKSEEIRRKVRRAKERFDEGIRQPTTASGYYEMGLYCQTGDGFYTYPKEAVQYFQKAAEKEHVHAQYQLALAYHTGEGTKKSEDECVKWLKKAAAKSHKEATELLDEILEKQRIKQEKTDFKNHLRQAEKGDAYAQAKVAELYLEGTGVKADIEKGIEWYEKASETDEGYAARQLARIYSEGKYVPEDGEKAAYWRMIGGVLDEL